MVSKEGTKHNPQQRIVIQNPAQVPDRVDDAWDQAGLVELADAVPDQAGGEQD